MTSRLSLIDLNVQLIILQYGNQETLENIYELLNKEFPEDEITMEELRDWEVNLKQYAWEIEELERYFEENPLVASELK